MKEWTQLKHMQQLKGQPKTERYGNKYHPSATFITKTQQEDDELPIIVFPFSCDL